MESNELRQRHIRINGRQVTFNKSSYPQRLVHPLQSNLKPQSIKFNNSNHTTTFSFSNNQYLQNFHFQKPKQYVKICIKPLSLRIEKRVITNSSEISCQKKKPYFMALQETRPHSINEYEVKNTGFTDFSLKQEFCISPKRKDNLAKKLQNSSALKPSLKPRTFSMNSQINKRCNVLEQNYFQCNFADKKEQYKKQQKQIQQILGIEKCLKPQNKGEVISYEQLDPPEQIEHVIKIRNEQETQELSNSNDQTLKISNERSFTEKKDKFQQSSIKIMYHNNQKQVNFNKTSFDQEVPPSEDSSNNQEIKIPKSDFLGHKRIKSLFTQSETYKSLHVRHPTFKFNSIVDGQFFTQVRGKRRKQILNSNDFQNQQSVVKNQDICQKLQSEFHKQHQNTNSSISLQDFDPIYQKEREILSKYLKSIKIKQSYDESLSISQEKQQFSLRQRQQNYLGVQFLEFVNQLSDFENEQNQIKRVQGQPSQNPIHTQNISQKWKLQQLIKIGQNEQQIYENRIIIHVISVWLNQMGYQRQQIKSSVIKNIKTLLLNVLNLTEQRQSIPIGDLRSQGFYYKQQFLHQNNLNYTVMQSTQKNKESSRRYSFDHQQDFKICQNAFKQENNQTKLKQALKYNCGLNNHLKRSLNTHFYRSKSPSNFYNQNNSSQEQNTLEETISKIYQNLYHKIVPVQLQLTILFHLCLNGWKFFEFLTVKILRQIYLHNIENQYKKNNDKPVNFPFLIDEIDKKLQKIIKNAVKQ